MFVKFSCLEFNSVHSVVYTTASHMTNSSQLKLRSQNQTLGSEHMQCCLRHDHYVGSCPEDTRCELIDGLMDNLDQQRPGHCLRQLVEHFPK